jgi:hypothetical protein
MGLLDPTPPPYAPLEWVRKPLAERGRMVCEAWAMQGYGTPVAVFFVYALKVVLYIGAWLGFVHLSHVPLLHPIAFQKAIVWSMVFEVLGLGCGSGPLTGRYFPPVGGFLYFLRPGTTKLPLFRSLGTTRGPLDVILYAALIVCCFYTLLARAPGHEHFVVLMILVPLLGLLDKTIFLAARAEHYWVTIVCFVFARDFIPAAMAVQLALWFWAGFSKLNHHFPTVACVMTSNGPLTRFPSLRRAMYRDFPNDLRPSKLANWIAHGGTALEIAVPLAFLLTPLGKPPLVAVILMLMLHGYITSNVPMGVPIEWNFMVVYGGLALFWAHPGTSLLTIAPWPLAVFLLAMTVLIPLLGNLFPSRISFLLAMRYYAGNWAYSVWLFRGDSYRKLDRLTRSSEWIYDQLARFYDRATSVGLLGKVMAFRMMHLHGRALSLLVPKAVERLEDYEWLDGEIVAGMVIGWNFGEGHLHQEQLLESIQTQCAFEEGELRCIFVESQPLGRATLDYRIHDAEKGELERGALEIPALREGQPWATNVSSPRGSI